MEPKSSLNLGILPGLSGSYGFGYGGTIISDSQQFYNYTGRKKSKVRLNDQLVPKPTDINMAEKMIKIAAPNLHPYSSHISKFAMFPSFRSPDEPFLNSLNSKNAQDVTLLSKAIGNPYRHEVLGTPMKTRKKTVRWTGEHGALDHSEPTRENQVFSAPPKSVLPNPKLCNDLSLSERTRNMLRNLERSHWITTYQMNHTGSGPANPLQIDDYKEKICDCTHMNSHTVPLRERSFPVFVPSKPRGGCRRRQARTCSPNQGTDSATVNDRPQEITAEYNEAPEPNQRAHSRSKYSSGCTEAQSTEPSQEVLHKQQTESRSSAYEGRMRENRKFLFYQSPTLSPRGKEANSDLTAGPEQTLDLNRDPPSQEEMEVNGEKSLPELCETDEASSKKESSKAGINVSGISQSAVATDLAGIEPHTKLSSRAASCQETLAKSRELPHSISNPGILPRPPVLPGIHPGDRVSLLDLQNSFSKSEAHRDFNSSVTHAAVNLRDNVLTGKKHNFYGVNCYYLHG